MAVGARLNLRYGRRFFFRTNTTCFLTFEWLGNGDDVGRNNQNARGQKGVWSNHLIDQLPIIFGLTRLLLFAIVGSFGQDRNFGGFWLDSLLGWCFWQERSDEWMVRCFHQEKVFGFWHGRTPFGIFILVFDVLSGDGVVTLCIKLFTCFEQEMSMHPFLKELQLVCQAMIWSLNFLVKRGLCFRYDICWSREDTFWKSGLLKRGTLLYGRIPALFFQFMSYCFLCLVCPVVDLL